MKSFFCHHCGQPTEDQDGKHSYFFFQGVMTENIPDEDGKYAIRPISGSVDPRPHGNPPRSFCSLKCFASWVNGKIENTILEYPQNHPLN